MALASVTRSNRTRCLKSIARSSVVEIRGPIRPSFLQWLPVQMAPSRRVVKTGRSLPGRTEKDRPTIALYVFSKARLLMQG